MPRFWASDNLIKSTFYSIIMRKSTKPRIRSTQEPTQEDDPNNGLDFSEHTMYRVSVILKAFRDDLWIKVT
jgi:hypothetical protein